MKTRWFSPRQLHFHSRFSHRPCWFSDREWWTFNFSKQIIELDWQANNNWSRKDLFKLSFSLLNIDTRRFHQFSSHSLSLELSGWCVVVLLATVSFDWTSFRSFNGCSLVGSPSLKPIRRIWRSNRDTSQVCRSRSSFAGFSLDRRTETSVNEENDFVF